MAGSSGSRSSLLHRASTTDEETAEPAAGDLGPTTSTRGTAVPVAKTLTVQGKG